MSDFYWLYDAQNAEGTISFTDPDFSHDNVAFYWQDANETYTKP